MCQSFEGTLYWLTKVPTLDRWISGAMVKFCVRVKAEHSERGVQGLGLPGHRVNKSKGFGLCYLLCRQDERKVRFALDRMVTLGCCTLRIIFALQYWIDLHGAGCVIIMMRPGLCDELWMCHVKEWSPSLLVLPVFFWIFFFFFCMQGICTEWEMSIFLK